MGRWGRVLRIGSVDSSKSCASTDVLKSQIVENERLERRLARNCRFFRRLLADPIPLRGQASKNPFLPTRFWATNVHDNVRSVVSTDCKTFGRDFWEESVGFYFEIFTREMKLSNSNSKQTQKFVKN